MQQQHLSNRLLLSIIEPYWLKGLRARIFKGMLFYSLLFASCWSSAGAYGLRQKENPIRRIVTLLQDMQKEIETEGKKEEKAYDKFMCYCDGNTDGMKAAAEAGSQKATELSSKLEALKAEKAQLEQELKDHQSSRETAKQDQEKATNIRKKEKEDFDAASADMSTNIAAMKGAISALEKGLGAFMQMGASSKAVLLLDWDITVRAALGPVYR